jgi:hypothetical protein
LKRGRIIDTSDSYASPNLQLTFKCLKSKLGAH